MNTAETRAAEAWADFESYQAQEKAKQLRPFTVRIGKRGSPRLEFAAMAKSSAECVNQHLDLCDIGERCECVPATK